MDQATPDKTRQEEAYDFISSTFVKLLEGDNRIGYEHKRSVIAFWEDLFAHEGVRNNMVQAFSNFLWEIDTKMDSSRKAGIQSVEDALQAQFNPQGMLYPEATLELKDVLAVMEQLLRAENQPEETIQDIENIDLSEVGGGNEDDTSPL